MTRHRDCIVEHGAEARARFDEDGNELEVELGLSVYKDYPSMAQVVLVEVVFLAARKGISTKTT